MRLAALRVEINNPAIPTARQRTSKACPACTRCPGRVRLGWAAQIGRQERTNPGTAKRGPGDDRRLPSGTNRAGPEIIDCPVIPTACGSWPIVSEMRTWRPLFPRVLAARVPGVAAVELARTDERLVGFVGEHRVDIALKVPTSRSGIRGESLGAQVDGYWNIESNLASLDPVGLFLGEYDGQPVHLRSQIHLTPHYAVRHADVSGAVGEHELRAHVAPVDAPACGPTIMCVDGDFDGAVITLFVSVEADLSEAHINGVINGNTVNIGATRSSVSGQCDGPAALFLLLTCSLLHFI